MCYNGIVHPNPESVVNEPIAPAPWRGHRSSALLLALCFLAAMVGAILQYNRAPDGYAQTVKDLTSAQARFDEVLNRPDGFYWPFQSVVWVISEEWERDYRCEIADALVTGMLTMDEGGSLDIRRDLENTDGEVLEGSAAAVFEAPEALWLVDYSPQLRENAALVFYKIPHDGSSDREIRDYGLDCIADTGYLEGNEIFDPADEDSYEENMFFSEPEFLGDQGQGEHFRPYWQEELDHAYQVAAQAFGL